MLLHQLNQPNGCIIQPKRPKISGQISVRRGEKHIVSAPEQLNNSINQVEKLYVIETKLSYIPKIGKLCHSALLLETKEGDFYILEFGIGLKHVIYCYKIPQQKSNSNLIIVPSYDKKLTVKWDKQKTGISLQTCQTIESIHNVMKNIVAKRKKYNLLNWNCHMAQENTRRSLGLKVNNPYHPIYISGSITIAEQVTVFRQYNI